MSIKRLYLLRHAKTEIGSATMQDHERVLIERGREDALRLGIWLNRSAIKVDQVMSSTSVRTRQTAEQLAQNWCEHDGVVFSDSLYLASAGDVLATVQSCDESHQSVMIIGHNPGIHQCALLLAGQAEHNALRDMEMNFPTCALAILEWQAAYAWRDVNPQSATLKAFYTRHFIADALAA